jgi:hypothetical protein
MMTVKNIADSIANEKSRSAWERGKKEYALELLETLEEAISGGYFAAEDLNSSSMIESALLNGAANWSQYSWGGCSLIYNEDIAERVCCPSELKKTRYGERRPNANEEWLDTQARALYQACNMIKRHARKLAKEA